MGSWTVWLALDNFLKTQPDSHSTICYLQWLYLTNLVLIHSLMINKIYFSHNLFHFYPTMKNENSNYWGLFPNHECHSFIGSTYIFLLSSSFYTNFSFENDLFSLNECANFFVAPVLSKLWLIGFAKLDTLKSHVYCKRIYWIPDSRVTIMT